VAVLPEPEVVNCPEAPDKSMVPAVGVTTVESWVVREFRVPAAAPRPDQVAVTVPPRAERLTSWYDVPETVSIQICPSW